MRTEDDLRAALTSLECHAPISHAALVPRPRRRLLAGRRGTAKTARVLAVVTACLAVAGVIMALTLPAGTRAGTPNEDVATPATPAAPATLRERLLAALSIASTEIVYVHSTTYTPGSAAPVVMDTWYVPWQARPGQLVRTRRLIMDPGGKPEQDVEDIYRQPAPGVIPAGLPANIAAKIREHRIPGSVAARGEIIDVEYGTRTWSDQKDHLLIDGDPGSPSVMALSVRTDHWTVVGRTTIAGHPAIEFALASADSTSHLWVGAGTYLPLREEVTVHAAGTGDNATIVSRDDYQLLPVTPANLARLTPPVPAGFRHTATQVLPPENGVG